MLQGLFNIGHGTVLDSGTTFTYLPSQAFKQLHKHVSDYALSHGLHSVPGPDPQFQDTCFGGGPSFDESHKLGEVFPSLELYFQVSMLTVYSQIRMCTCGKYGLVLRLLFIPRGLDQGIDSSILLVQCSATTAWSQSQMLPVLKCPKSNLIMIAGLLLEFINYDYNCID